MKALCFVLNGNLPVPAVKGGAIEQLVEILVNQNECDHTFEFTVVGPFEEKAIIYQQKYQYTKFVNIRYSPKWNRRLGTVRAIVNKLFHKDFALLSLYNYRVEQYLLSVGEAFDYIVNEHADDGLFLRPAIKIGKAKFVNHLHMVTKATDTIQKAFHKYISVSNYVQDYYIETSNNNLNSQFAVLYNCVEMQKFKLGISHQEHKKLRERIGFNNEDFIIAFCGRIKDFKGVKELIEAILSIEDIRVKLMVIGASETNGVISPYEVEIKKKAQKAPNRILFTGYVDNADLYKYYKVSDIGAVPTICEEAFNMVILEMMASGLPTIATKSGGMVEVGNSDSTLFVEKDGDLTNELKSAIMFLYEHPEVRKSMKNAAVERAKFFDGNNYLYNFKKTIVRFAEL